MTTPQDGCCNRAPWDLKGKPKHTGFERKNIENVTYGNLGKQLFNSGPFLQTKNLRNNKTHKKIWTLRQNYNWISVILANTLTLLLHTEGTVPGRGEGSTDIPPQSHPPQSIYSVRVLRAISVFSPPAADTKQHIWLKKKKILPYLKDNRTIC